MGQITPAPWRLTGNGYVMLFKFPKPFILEHGFLDPRFREGFYGNVGAIFFADYHTSNAGPYQELLFVPGKLRYRHHKAYSVSKVFVSTATGAENACLNWGIPKEQASFIVTRDDKGLETIKVTRDGVAVFDVTIKTPEKGVTFPVSTLFWPLPLVQHYSGKTFYFNPRGGGSGKLGEILKVEVNPELFPNFAFFKHVAIIRVSNFRLKLPAAKVKAED